MSVPTTDSASSSRCSSAVGEPAILVNVPGAAATRVGEVAAVLHAIGANRWLVGQGAPAVPDATVFVLPELPEVISPLPTVLPMPLLAYRTAVLKGLNPDTFRRDNPVCKDAFGLLRL